MPESMTYHAGQPITLVGYADDFEGAVTAVRFSQDEGRHWTVRPTDEATLGSFSGHRHDAFRPGIRRKQ